ncbi:hypothetical protein ACNOYE_09090 [Nannocystaceae bacterium ST9]
MTAIRNLVSRRVAGYPDRRRPRYSIRGKALILYEDTTTPRRSSGIALAAAGAVIFPCAGRPDWVAYRVLPMMTISPKEMLGSRAGAREADDHA